MRFCAHFLKDYLILKETIRNAILVKRMHNGAAETKGFVLTVQAVVPEAILYCKRHF